MKDPLAKARKFARENPHFAADHGINEALDAAAKMAKELVRLSDLVERLQAENAILKGRTKWRKNYRIEP